MDVIFRQILLIPFIILMFFVDLRDHPNRVFQGTGMSVVEPSGTWEKGAPLPTQRYDFGASVLNDELYVVGGLVLPSPWIPTNRVEKYNATTDSWTKIANYPRVVHHPGVIACDGYVYVVGGYWLRVMPSSNVYRLNPASYIWERQTDLPTPRGALGVACIADKIYAVGGDNDDGQLSQLTVFDTKNNSWEIKTPMLTAREHLVFVAVDKNIYALGGLLKDRYNSLPANEMYEPTTDTWTTRAPIPHAINGFTAAVLGRSIFIFGGARGDATSNEVFEYKTDEDMWYRRNNLPIARYGMVSGTIGKKIHVIGGNSIVKGNYLSQEHDIFEP